MDQIKCEEKKSGIDLNPWILGFLAIAILLGISAAAAISGQINNVLNKKIADIEEAKRPANLKITVIKDANCTDCFEVKSLVDYIKKANVKIESEKELDISDKEGKELVAKLNIAKIPTIIVSGELQKDEKLNSLWPTIGSVKDEDFVLSKTGFPYVVANTGEIKGRVKIVLLSNKSCDICFDAEKYGNLLSYNIGLPMQFKETIDSNSIEGRKIINKYDVKAIPTAVVTGDVDSYPALAKIGDIKNGAFVLTKINAPYAEVNSGKIRGKTNIIYITDKTCGECYGSDVYDNILKNFNIYFQNKKNVDVSSSEGVSMLKKYDIKSVPALIINGDFAPYNSLNPVWNTVGKMEKDGAYVLREEGMKQLGIYKDIINNKIVTRE